MDERERRAAGAAGDVKHVARRRFADQIGDDGLLVETSPALLADILTIDFTSNVGGDFALKSSVLGSIELGAIGPLALIDSTHDGPPPQEQRFYVANASHDPTLWPYLYKSRRGVDGASIGGPCCIPAPEAWIAILASS